MFKVHKVERQIGGKTLSIETGKIARQADGAVLVKYEDTIVMVTSVSAPPKFDDIDYFPLSVDYREKFSAAGKFPGGFMKREGRPSTKEILTARMIDRPIRPLFPDGYFYEVQILCSVMSADQQNDPDVLAMIGASASLVISKIPFQGPLAACRVSYVDGKYIINPTHSERENSQFNLVLAGRKNSVNMIEVDAKEASEEVVTNGIEEGQKVITEICGMLEELQEKCGAEKELPEIEQDDDGKIEAELSGIVSSDLKEAFEISEKKLRNERIKEIKTAVTEKYFDDLDEGQEPICSQSLFKRILSKIEEKVIRSMILEKKTRPDGRGYEDLRPINCEVGLLPRTHGSALFTRGETQALVTVTLGTGRDEQTVDGLQEEYGQKFMLHYNFPPSSVGEVRFIRGPGRREIGHGALAEKALAQLMPGIDDFPYTVKLVSDITESNGSSSMASICGGCLAMMDAGVPVKKIVAGISVGMISDDSGHVLLTDILGDEDHFGDMDFKVAGTADGITAIQLDLKLNEIPIEIVKETLERARQVRLKIIDIMSRTIDKPKPEISVYAPKILTIKIDPEYIGKVIGPGGAMIRGIQEETETVIEIEEDGTVMISCVGGNGHKQAQEIIENMTRPPEVGKIYPSAKVVSVKDFGVFVELSPGVEGLCHVSELDNSYVKNVEDVCKAGDIIPVKLLSIDDQGRFKLSRKAALAEQNKEQ